MGLDNEQWKSDRKKKKSERGSVANKRRLAAFSARGAKGQADWGTCDPDRLLAVVVGITGLGGAVTIGLSRDEGAHSLTLLLDNERQTLWFNGDADLNARLDEVLQTISQMD